MHDPNRKTQEADVDPRWRALTEGALSKEEAEALKAEAEQSDELRALYDLYRPFDPVENEQLFAAVSAHLCAHERSRRRRRLAILLGALVLLATTAAVLARRQ
jgi:hypothetical protein